MKIRNLTQTCMACPSQWEAETEDGTPVYIRYRFGNLQFWLDQGGPKEECVYSQNIGDGLDGILGQEEMKRIFKLEEVA